VLAIAASALCAGWAVGYAAWYNFGVMSGLSENAEGAIGLVQYSVDHSDEKKEGVDPAIERGRKTLKALEFTAKLSVARESSQAALAVARNNLAWALATSAIPGARRPAEALALAKQAVEADPKTSLYVNTLGVAQYAAGDYAAAIDTLNRSMRLHDGGDAYDFFFLAMSYAQKGDRPAAVSWYERGVRWLAANQATKPKEFERIRAEAAGLVLTPPSPAEPKTPAKPQEPPETKKEK